MERSSLVETASRDLGPKPKPGPASISSTTSETRNLVTLLRGWNPLQRRLLPLSAFQRLAGAAAVAVLLWLGFFWATAEFSAR